MLIKPSISSKWLLLVPFVVLVSSLLLLLLPSLYSTNHQTIYRALCIDLCFTLPLSYLLISGKAKVSKAFTVPLIIIGIVLASLFVPSEFQSPVSFAKTWVLPLIELSAISFLAYKVYLLRKNYIGTTRAEFYNDLQQAALQVFPKKVAHILSFEIAVFYYAFSFPKPFSLSQNEFSTFKNSGIKAILSALIMAILVETVGIHFLLAKWSHTSAWVFSALSVYTAIQVLAVIRSLAYRPVVIGKKALILQFGIMHKAIIPFELIEDFNEISDDELQEFKGQKLSPFYQNVVFKLNADVKTEGIYGFTKTTSQIAIFIDNPKDFINSLKTKLIHLNTHCFK